MAIGLAIVSALVYILIQGSSKAYFADNLFSGFTYNSLLMNSFASLEMFFHSLEWKEINPSNIFSKICSSFFPVKGGEPLNKTWSIIPIDQISHF